MHLVGNMDPRSGWVPMYIGTVYRGSETSMQRNPTFRSCRGLEWPSLQRHVNVALFGKRVFVDVIRLRILRCNHPGGEWALSVLTSLYKRREGKRDPETRERRPCDNGGRYWSDAIPSQRTPGAIRSWKRQGSLLL